MRRLLNVLYVTTPDAYLTCENQNVLVRIDDRVQLRVPIHNLEGIVSFGHAGASPALMALCASSGVALTFLSQNGRFLARVTGEVSGNVALRRTQYRLADSEASATIAASCITGKVANCRTVLLRAVRDHGDGMHSADCVRQAAGELASVMRRLDRLGPLDSLRGLEGEAARAYFGVLNELVLVDCEDFRMLERNRRPPKDPLNALLSFLYALLAHDVQAALETVGLDPQVGFLHRDRPGRPGLALDLMEELRPVMADRLVLSLVNRRQVKASGFIRGETGGVRMDDDTRKTVIAAWHARKQEEIMHPYLREKIPLGLVAYAQAMLLARHLRGDLDGYPPFFWK